MRSSSRSLGFPARGFIPLSLAALFACGSPPSPDAPQTSSIAKAVPSVPPSIPTAKAVVPEAEAKSTRALAAPPEPLPKSAAEAGSPVGFSTLRDALKKDIGLDLAKAPRLEKLSLSQKKKIMPSFVSALGYTSCGGCHAAGDYGAETRNMRITREMWNHFVVGMRDEKGGPVFCDSCHDKSAKILRRADKKALSRFMDENYVKRLARADGKENGCTHCHGDEMEMNIFDKLWKVH